MDIYIGYCVIQQNKRDGIRLESSPSPSFDNFVYIDAEEEPYGPNTGDDLDIRDSNGNKIANDDEDPNDWDLGGVAPDL